MAAHEFQCLWRVIAVRVTKCFDRAAGVLFQFTFAGNDFDFGNAIAVDTLGNVYVTGGVGYDFLMDSDYATIKYDSDGNQVWVSIYNGTGNDYDEASSIVLDSSRNIYVTGGSYGNGTWNDYTTLKYDPEGNSFHNER